MIFLKVTLVVSDVSVPVGLTTSIGLSIVLHKMQFSAMFSICSRMKILLEMMLLSMED